MYVGSNSSTFFLIVVIIFLFNFSYYHVWEVIFHCGFNLYFLGTNDIEQLFMSLLVICSSSLEKCLFKYSAHLKITLCVFLLLNFKGSLYIPGTCSISDTTCANISFHFVNCLFTFLMVSFEAQNLCLMMSDLSNMSFEIYNFVSYLRNNCLT